MHSFDYARPASLAEAVTLLADAGPDGRVLAGGTDLVIRLRDGTLAPRLVIDLKRVRELRPGITLTDHTVAIGATTVMTDIAADPTVCRAFPALAEAAAVVGSVQIRNRATIGGNICNASPAADALPPLLVHDATVVAEGPAGTRRIAMDAFLVRSGITTLARGEIVTAIELPVPADRRASVHLRRTRRRGHDLASVTLCCGIDGAGETRLAWGSVGPRPILCVDPSGILADPAADAEARAEILEGMFEAASPSPRSMRAGPAYRLAMLRVLGRRALGLALARRATGGA